MVSRASILSGQYASKHKINDFFTSFSKGAITKTYPYLLKNAGYYTGFIGKFGVGEPKEQPDTLFNYWAGTPMHQPNYKSVNSKGDSIHYTDLVDQKIQEFLSKTTEKPFCLSVSFKSPHAQDGDPRQFIPKKEYADLYKDIHIPEPVTAAPEFWDLLPSFFHEEENIARERWKLRFDTPEKYQRSVKNYYRLITGVDDVVGNLMAQVRQKGLDKNTVIIFMGDNGMYLGEHGLAGKWFGHEESVRVPLFIYDPRNSTNAKPTEDIGLNIDIAPTILSLAHLTIPEEMQGIDLLDSKQRSIRSDFYYEHTFLGSPKLPKTQGVVSPEMKYLYYPEFDYEELYALKSDPHELENLVKEPKYQDILSQKRKRFSQLQEEAKN